MCRNCQVVAAACDALRRRHGKGPTPALELPPSAFVTALLVPAGGAIALDVPALQGMGIRCGRARLFRTGPARAAGHGHQVRARAPV